MTHTQQQSNSVAATMASSVQEYKFLVELDDELKCMICLGVARDPLQHEECGKLFCKDCLEKYGRDKSCPNCRQENSSYWVDKRSKRNIDALGVKCHNADRKCPWEGTVATVEAHMTTCQFALLPCPNQCKDEEDQAQTNHYMRKELKQHQLYHCPNRRYKCQYCGEKGTYATITHTHDQVCLKKPISCPNKDCKATMQRGLVGDHVECECAYTVLPCKYKSFGCNVERKRQDMAAHEHDDKQYHLDMAMDSTLQLKNTTLELKKQMAEMCSALNILRLTTKSDPLTFRLTDYQKQKRENSCTEFPSLYIKPHSYRIVFQIDANGFGDGEGTHTSASIRIVEGDYDDDLKWPCLCDITVTLLNQLEDKNHHHETIRITAEVDARPGSIKGEAGIAWGKPKFISHFALDYDPVRNTQYLKDDTLYFRISCDISM